MIEISATIDGVSKRFEFDPTKGRGNFPELAAIQDRMDDLTPVMGEIHDILLSLQKRIFDTQGSVIGQQWPDYNDAEREAYVPMKRAILDSEYPVLRWLGPNERLYPSLTDKNHSKHIWKTTKDAFEFGTDVSYAYGHHTGTGAGWKNKYTVPKRPLIGSTWDALGDIIQQIQGYVFGSKSGYSAKGGIFG